MTDDAKMKMVEIQERTITLCSDLLYRTALFWLSITSVLVGYVILNSEEIDFVIREWLIGITILAAFVFLVFSVFASNAIIKGVKIIDCSIKALNASAYKDTNMSEFTRTFRRATILCATACAVFIITVMIVLCNLQGLLQ